MNILLTPYSHTHYYERSLGSKFQKKKTFDSTEDSLRFLNVTQSTKCSWPLLHFYEGWDLNFKKRKLSIRQKTLEILQCHTEYKMQLVTPINHKSYAVTRRLSSSSAHGTFDGQSPLLGRNLIRSTVVNTGNRISFQPTVGANLIPKRKRLDHCY